MIPKDSFRNKIPRTEDDKVQCVCTSMAWQGVLDLCYNFSQPLEKAVGIFADILSVFINENLVSLFKIIIKIILPLWYETLSLRKRLKDKHCRSVINVRNEE